MLELNELVETLKSRLSDETEKSLDAERRFASQLEEEKSRTEETAEKLFSSRRELFAAGERMRELHSNAVSTYVNTTLIWKDCVYVLAHTERFMWRHVGRGCEIVSPYWNMFVDIMIPLIAQLREVANDALVPALKRFSRWYKRHGQPLADHVAATLGPATAPISEATAHARNVAGDGVTQVAQFLQHYLELVDAKDPSLRDWVASGLGWIAANNQAVVALLFGLVLGLLVLALVLLPLSYGTPTKGCDGFRKAQGTPIEPSNGGAFGLRQ